MFKQPRRHKRLQLILGDRLSALRHDSGPDILTVMTRVGDSEAHSLPNLRVMEQRIVQLNGTNLLPALIDEFLDTTGDEDVSLRVFPALIARAEEAVRRERRRVRGRVVQVALGHVLAADADLRFLAVGYFVAVLVEDFHLNALSDADAAGLALARWEGVAGHLVRGLGHSVRFQDGCLEG